MSVSWKNKISTALLAQWYQKHEFTMSGKKISPDLLLFLFFFSPTSYECFSGAYNLDVLLTKHRLQLLFPAFRLRDPKLDYVLLMRASWKKHGTPCKFRLGASSLQGWNIYSRLNISEHHLVSRPRSLLPLLHLVEVLSFIYQYLPGGVIIWVNGLNCSSVQSAVSLGYFSGLFLTNRWTWHERHHMHILYY